MATRLRYHIATGLAGIAVVIALTASAWLAYATTAPQGTPSYPGVTTTTTPSTATTAPHATTPTTSHTPETTVAVGDQGSGNSPPTTGTAMVSDNSSHNGDDGLLPFTGAATLGVALVALACIAGGLILASRRRAQRA